MTAPRSLATAPPRAVSVWAAGQVIAVAWVTLLAAAVWCLGRAARHLLTLPPR